MVNANMPDPEFCRPVNDDFNPETGYIVVNVNKIDFQYDDREVVFQGKVFSPKDELHITVVSNSDAEQLRRYLEQNPDAVSSVREILDETDFSFRKLDELYHVVEAPGVETIIRMVEIPMLMSFFQSLSGLVGSGFILPPTHITLYTRGTERGIALPDQAAFNELVKGHIQPGEVMAKSSAGGSISGQNEQGLAQ